MSLKVENYMDALDTYNKACHEYEVAGKFYRESRIALREASKSLMNAERNKEKKTTPLKDILKAASEEVKSWPVWMQQPKMRNMPEEE